MDPIIVALAKAAGLEKTTATFADRAVLARRMLDGVTLATADAQEAMRVVHAHAKDWGVDPAKIGVLGFSAGAITTMNLVYADDAGHTGRVGLALHPSRHLSVFAASS